jgi:tetratricopeptide (TPR) repeat protein
VQQGDENLLALESQLPNAKSLSTDKQISLHYALGKAYDDLKNYDQAFPHFIEGARLKRSKLNYDAKADQARVEHIINLVDKPFFDTLLDAGDPSNVPIFILGMPRSGTTLTEQIIASHPDVYGAGELDDLMAIVQRQIGNTSTDLTFPASLKNLDPDTLSAWGQDYITGLHQQAPNAKHITDKMPINYMAMGLIPLMLPHAKIIHVKRNPIDTCVSCFTRLFNRHQDASYDLNELGQHYASYARLMDHWQQVMPSDSFIEVQYEHIVADIEQQARRLIEFCNLNWDNSCLDFYNTKRSIRTASVTQVRQPIYTSSVERWRHYEAYLQPLLESLGEFAVHH